MPIEGREGNVRGKETEARVAAVLRSLPYVAEVMYTEDHTEDIDLQVHFSPYETTLPFPSVFIQVKSSNQHVYEYRKEKGPDVSRFSPPLTWKEIEQIRTDYFANKRTVIINGGIKRNKKKKHNTPVSDESIITRFEDQINYIAEYYTAKDHCIFPG